MTGHVVRPGRPRILMIGPYPSSPERINGGVAAALKYLSDALVAGGEVDLSGVRIARNAQDRCDASSYLFPVDDLPLGRFSLSTMYRRQLGQLREIIATRRPDIVHAQGADISGYLAVRCGVPAVVTIHGLLAECARYQTELSVRLRATLAAAVTERDTVRRAQHLIAISPYVRRYYGSEVTARVHDVPNAVAPAYFDVARTPEPGRLLYAGRISHGKGLFELVNAVARARSVSVHLVLAGAMPDPNYGVSLRDETKRLGLAERVTFAGLLDEPQLVGEFGRAQALILPSHQETAPMVIQQAMAAGLPVIATQVGGIPDQIEHERTGLMFEAGDVGQLSSHIERIVREIELPLQIGLAARTVANERFRASAVAAATVAVYRSMLQRGVRQAS